MTMLREESPDSTRTAKGSMLGAMVKKTAAMAILSSSLSLPVPMAVPPVNAAPVSAVLEEKVVALENAESRKDTLQGLADVFEAAGSRTLLARTKYKYVSSASTAY